MRIDVTKSIQLFTLLQHIGFPTRLIDLKKLSSLHYQVMKIMNDFQRRFRNLNGQIEVEN